MELTPGTTAPGGAGRWKRVVAALRSFRELTLLLTILTVVAVMALRSQAFRSRLNAELVLRHLSRDGIVAIGMTVALVSGGFDLSVGSVLALSTVVMGTLFAGGTNIWLAACAGLGVGLMCGLLNGALIGYVGLNPLITTLGMMGMARGVCMGVTRGSPISLHRAPEAFRRFSSAAAPVKVWWWGEPFQLHIVVLVFVAIVLLGELLLRRSVPGRKVYYIGSNEQAAVLSGINVRRIKLCVYALVGFLAAFAGVLDAARQRSASPNSGQGLELYCISAVVIGGASLAGGQGTALGSALGIVLLALIPNVLVLEGVSPYWQYFFVGAVLVATVTVDHVIQQRRIKKGIQ